jgi:RNA polymerase sigma-70 factor (ECF subfamily)
MAGATGLTTRHAPNDAIDWSHLWRINLEFTMPEDPSLGSPRAEGRWFATTHWSVVLAAGAGQSPGAQAALAKLCGAYWYPLYAYVRREGYAAHDAQDLTQEFFARLLAKDFLRSVGQEKGRFRSFLLVALKRFLVNEWQRTHAAKRGGGKCVPLDEVTAENRYHLEPVDEMTAEKLYVRRWAMTLLEQVLGRLRHECRETGKERQFEELKIFLSTERGHESYAAIGLRLGWSVGGVKSAVSRLRARYREMLREDIAHTVTSAAEVEDELRYLISVLQK